VTESGSAPEGAARLAAALSDRYRIERELGAGGMATVYLAQDLKHHRKVAVKVLRPELAAVIGADRFLSEIRTTANLQHPHILPLFDSGAADSFLYYVMPYIEGISLRDRLSREKQLPIGDAVRLATEIAGALDYAHRHGVIHRDIKPENILLHDGSALVADFGIALAASKAGTRMTETGMSLGTPQYMSPEQAMGERELDARSDVYALGCVTYEMLTGEPPFSGPTAQAIVAKVMTAEPVEMTTLRKTIPADVADAVHIALQKLPADRFASAAEFAAALRGGSGGTSTRTMTPRAPSHRQAAGRGARWRQRVPWGVAALAVCIAAWLGLRRPAPAAVMPVQFIIAGKGVAEPVATLTWPATVSPDGRTIVYAGASGTGVYQYYAREVGRLESRPIAGTSSASAPLFSPDGKWLAFQAGDGRLEKVDLVGGAPIPLATYASGNGIAWSPRGTIVTGAAGAWLGLARVSENGGELKQFTTPDSAHLWHVWPVMLADGKRIVFSIWNQLDRTLHASHLAITSLDDGVVHRLGVLAARALGMRDDVLVYLTGDGVVMASHIDLKHYRAIGSPVTLIDSIPMCASCNGDGTANLSAGGALTYMRGTMRGQLTWMTPDHHEQPVGKGGLVAPMISPRLSPDGSRIAVEITGDQHRDIWIYEIATGNKNKLTSGGDNSSPEWLNDGKSIQFLSTRGGRTGIWRQPIDNSRDAAEVLNVSSSQGWAAVPSPDQHHVLLDANNGAAVNLVTGIIGADSAAVPFVSGSFNAWGGRFSPSGKWVAYVSDESSRPEIYVRPFPGPGGRTQVSTAGGMEPFWSRDGKSVYYASGTRLMVAKLTPEPAVSVISHDSLFSWPFSGIYFTAATYDVAPDGRILLIKPSDERYQLVVALNWAADLAARMAKP
jgi:Tol biopolymer transport system component/tRNA A-37 threonylcarbamoyl transferase component Bud32